MLFRSIKYQTFSGQVLAHVDLFLRYRALTDTQHTGNAWGDTNDFEAIADAAEDALLESIDAQKATLRVAGYYWNGDYRLDRDPVTLHGDGHDQRLAFALGFERQI